MMRDNVTFELLTRDKILSGIHQILSISELSFGKNSWSEHQYLYELPDKWKLSSIISSENKIVGYLILSSYKSKNNEVIAQAHIMAIHKKLRGFGFAKDILLFSKQLCIENNIRKITTETTRDLSANHITGVIEKIGFKQITDIETITGYLEVKKKSDLLPLYLNDDARIYLHQF